LVQSLQLLLPEAAYLPAVQSIQVLALSAEYFPTEHVMHAVAPVEAAKVPPLQLKQVFLPALG
jgi:hypothetical protein